MKVDSARFVPVLFDFPEIEARQTCWGRFLDLSSIGARLITASRLKRGDRLSLDFDLPGESLADVRARIVGVYKDKDGYFVGELIFLESADRTLLGRVLARILTSASRT